MYTGLPLIPCMTPACSQRSAGEPREDDGFMGAHILEHAENFHLELFDAIPGEDGASGAVHAGADIL